MVKGKMEVGYVWIAWLGMDFRRRLAHGTCDAAYVDCSDRAARYFGGLFKQPGQNDKIA